jgi:peptidoglycan/LPS O-acetylase OafA/YrhL
LRIIGYNETIWKGAFVPFTGWIFYLLCGAWINRWGVDRKIKKIVTIAWILQLVYILVLGMLGRSEIINLMYGYTSFLTWTTAILLFDGVEQENFINSKLKTIMRKLADDSLGIYIFHVMILMMVNKCFEYMHIILNPWVFSILQILIAIFLSIMITKVVKKIPVLNKIV